MKADIIIPTYKPAKLFSELLGRLERQAGYIEDIIIINTEEKLMPEETKALLSSLNGDETGALFGKIRLYHIRKEEFDHAATRRRGVSCSKAQYFVLMTDDAVPYNDELLKELLAPLKDENTAVSYARQLAREGSGRAERYTREFNYPEEGRLKTAADIEKLGIKAFFASDVCCAYNRRIYDLLGGLVERAIFNEDMIYAAKALKAGYAVSYTAKAMVVHSHDYGMAQQFHRNFDLGMSQAEHPEVFAGVGSEGEGIRLVKNTAAYLIRSGCPLELFPLFFKSGAKYLGYRLGKSYKKLPEKAVRLFSQNKTYIDNIYK